MLDVAVARMLGGQENSGDLRTLGGDITGATAVPSRVPLGPIVARSVPGLAAVLSHMQPDLGERIDRGIGLEVLRAASFTIDHEDRRIAFGPAPQYRNWVPFADGPPMITVKVEVDGKRKRLPWIQRAMFLHLARGGGTRSGCVWSSALNLEWR